MNFIIIICIAAIGCSNGFSISVSRDYVVVETNTTSPYVDDDVAITYIQPGHNEYAIEMLDLSTGAKSQHSSRDPEFVACSTINTRVVCTHRV